MIEYNSLKYKHSLIFFILEHSLHNCVWSAASVVGCRDNFSLLKSSISLHSDLNAYATKVPIDVILY